MCGWKAGFAHAGEDVLQCAAHSTAPYINRHTRMGVQTGLDYPPPAAPSSPDIQIMNAITKASSRHDS